MNTRNNQFCRRGSVSYSGSLTACEPPCHHLMKKGKQDNLEGMGSNPSILLTVEMLDGLESMTYKDKLKGTGRRRRQK